MRLAVAAARTEVLNNFDPWDLAVHAGRDPAADGGLDVVFAGNLGRFQGLEHVVDLIRGLTDEPRLRWHFFGDGPLRTTLDELAAGGAPVTLHGYRPAAEVADFVRTRADLGIVSLNEGVIRSAYPSKTLTYLRNGCPLLVLVEQDTELAQMVRDRAAGGHRRPSTTLRWRRRGSGSWWLDPGDLAGARARAAATYRRGVREPRPARPLGGPGRRGDRGAGRMTTRAIDAVLALAGLVVTSPLLALSAVAVRLSSPGPVLHRAERAGRGGVPFTMYKLRTMRVDSAGVGRITAGRDPRILPVGRVLRRAKLDELPQLVNVLRGEMALVGPRPEDLSIVREHYDAMMWESLDVPPGVTSPGSLHYFADEADLPDDPVAAESRLPRTAAAGEDRPRPGLRAATAPSLPPRAAACARSSASSAWTGRSGPGRPGNGPRRRGSWRDPRSRAAR